LQPLEKGGINMQDLKIMSECNYKLLMPRGFFNFSTPLSQKNGKSFPDSFLEEATGLSIAVFCAHPSILKRYFPSSRWAT
jgi:hypothetical protein